MNVFHRGIYIHEETRKGRGKREDRESFKDRRIRRCSSRVARFRAGRLTCVKGCAVNMWLGEQCVAIMEWFGSRDSAYTCANANRYEEVLWECATSGAWCLTEPILLKLRGIASGDPKTYVSFLWYTYLHHNYFDDYNKTYYF